MRRMPGRVRGHSKPANRQMPQAAARQGWARPPKGRSALLCLSVLAVCGAVAWGSSPARPADRVAAGLVPRRYGPGGRWLRPPGWPKVRPTVGSCGRGGKNLRRCRHRRFPAVWLGPYPVTQRDEIRAGLRKRANLVRICGITYTGWLKKFRPPRQTFLDNLELRAAAAPVGFAEHHVIGVSFARQHGIMTAAQIAGPGNPVWFEHGECGLERLDPGQMGTIGSGACLEGAAATEQERSV